jgi:hypothetical protein
MRSLLLAAAVVVAAATPGHAQPNPYCVTGMDWRANGRMVKLGMPGGLDDWNGSLAYRWGVFDEYNIPCMTNPTYRWTTPPFHAYQVDTDSILDPAATEAWVVAHPGKVYLIGNEPNNPDLAAGDGMTPPSYARMFHTYYTFIKALDPTAKIAVGGLVATADTNSFNATTNWWNQVLSEYRNQFGVEMPVEIWNNHCYAYVGSLDPDRIIAEYFAPFRQYVNTVSGGIYAGEEIWCTEYGVGMWSTPLHPDYMAEFVQQLCPRLEASGAVDRFFWFLGPWESTWRDSALLDQQSVPTVVGVAYSQLANSYPNPIPDPPADPPSPVRLVESDFETDAAPWRPIAGDWVIDGGAYRQTRIGAVAKWGMKVHLPYWYRNVEIECDLKINTAEDPMNWVGVDLRHGTIWQDGIRGYLIFLRQNGELGLNNKVDGTVATVAGAVADTSVYHRLKVRLVDSHFEISVDGDVVLTWDDPNNRRSAGLVSLESGKTDCSFDNVVVREVREAAPTGFYQAGWNLTSVPVEPFYPDASIVFQDLIDLGHVIRGNLYRYDPATGYMIYDPPIGFSNVIRGQGYWLWLDAPADTAVVSVAGATATSDVSLSLAQGWKLIGHPFPSPVLLSDCRASDGAVTLSFAQAVAAGWVSGTLYYWDADGGYQALSAAGYGHDDTLRPWRGYWIRAMRAGLSLVVPRP